MKNGRASLEALLFIHGEPLSYKKIQSVLGIEKEELETLIGELKTDLEADTRGLQLISDREKIQLATKPEFNSILERFMKEEISEDLTRRRSKRFPSLRTSGRSLGRGWNTCAA